MNAFFDFQFKYCLLIVALIKGKLIGSMKDALGSFTTISSHDLRRCLKRIGLFLFMKRMYEFWLLKCIRSAMTFNLII